jgi:hypothetical protein
MYFLFQTNSGMNFGVSVAKPQSTPTEYKWTISTAWWDIFQMKVNEKRGEIEQDLTDRWWESEGKEDEEETLSSNEQHSLSI